MRAEQVPQARSSSPASVSGNYADFYKNNFFPSRYSCTSYILKVLYFCYSKGILAGAQLTLPKDCKNNKFCEITKMILGPTVKFYIYGNFEWKKVKVAVGFAHIRIWDGLYFDKLELYVEVSPFWPFCLRFWPRAIILLISLAFEATGKKSERSLEVELMAVSIGCCHVTSCWWTKTKDF